jgi:beta-galactosidase
MNHSMNARFPAGNIAAALLLVFSAIDVCAQTPLTVSVPDSGWHLWLDRKAKWEDDKIFLPDATPGAEQLAHEPTGGWDALDAEQGIEVSLPSTVEQHFWGAAGFRKYSDAEYLYANSDTAVKNGSYSGGSGGGRGVEVPASFKDKTILLTIRGARLRAEVYVNGRLVGYDIISETAFTCDASAACVPGSTNRIAVRITNPGGRFDWMDTELLRWGSASFHRSHGFGGLDGGIALRAAEAVHISDAWVLNTKAVRQVWAQARIANPEGLSTDGSLVFEILDPDNSNKVCASTQKKFELQGDEATIKVLLGFKNARLWSCETPKLYKLRVKMTCAPRKKGPAWRDARERTFGFRWFDADSLGTNAVLRLNGKRTRLYSAISWGYWGLNGLWPTKELAERETAAAKELGLNCLQFHRNIGKTEALDAHDRLGLLRYMEPGGGITALGGIRPMHAPSPVDTVNTTGEGGAPGTFAESYMEEKIVRMIRDHRSHPSLVMYCIQNEIDPDMKNPRIFHLLRRMREEDPSRIIILKSGVPPANQAWLLPYDSTIRTDDGTGASGWRDEHTVGGPGIWRDEMYVKADSLTHYSRNDSEVVIWGEMLGSASPDNHSSMLRRIAENGGGSYDKSDHAELARAYDRFLDAWNFRAAFPTADSLFNAIGNRSYDFWGRVMATARLAEADDGFVISGWESTAIENHSGLVDNLRGFKGNPSLLRRGLDPFAVVMRPASRVMAAGDTARCDVYLLNETHKPHGGALRLFATYPSGEKIEVGSYEIPEYVEDVFVYHVAARVPVPARNMEGSIALTASIDDEEPVFSESLLVVALDAEALPRKIAVASMDPEFSAPFDLVPGFRVEPYQIGRKYDAVIVADRVRTPRTAFTEPDRPIAKTDDPVLYRSVHYGAAEDFDYVFNRLGPGDARITMKFVEPFRSAAGERVFDVDVNDETVLRDFDVFKAAGGKDVAFDTTFHAYTSGGAIRITVPRVSAGSARIAALKIETDDTVITVNCGGGDYRDKLGRLWKRYETPVRLDRNLLEKVRTGMPLIVLAEGEGATDACGRLLGDAGAIKYNGHVGAARASWMGSWYFTRPHPLLEGLPAGRAMGSDEQTPTWRADGMLLEGKDLEVAAGYSRDHDRNIGAGIFAARCGKGRIVVCTVPGLISAMRGRATGIHPVIGKRLLLNALKYLKR